MVLGRFNPFKRGKQMERVIWAYIDRLDRSRLAQVAAAFRKWTDFEDLRAATLVSACAVDRTAWLIAAHDRGKPCFTPDVRAVLAQSRCGTRKASPTGIGIASCVREYPAFVSCGTFRSCMSASVLTSHTAQRAGYHRATADLLPVWARYAYGASVLVGESRARR